MFKEAKHHKEADALVRYEPEIAVGLKEEEVLAREKAGLSNKSNVRVDKPYWKIFTDNIFTVFNITLYAIGLLFLITSLLLNHFGHNEVVAKYFGISKYGFLGPATINMVIGIIQECRSKRVLEKLRLVAEAKAHVIRDGKEQEILASKLVADDIVIFRQGEQVTADAKVLDGLAELDESLLTGESNTVTKRPKANCNEVYSGSSVMAGAVTCVVTKVGEEAYANTLQKKVKKMSRKKSELMKNLYGILNVMSILLFLVVAVVVSTMVYKVNRWGSVPGVFPEAISLSEPSGWAQIITTTSAFAIGVIPTGLVLTTSITLAVSTIYLASQKTLIQELYSLESLSRVDVICLDKTGTLTDGTMSVESILYENSRHEETNRYIRLLLGAMTTQNATSKALQDYFGSEVDRKFVLSATQFSSARKYSGIKTLNGAVKLGAPEYLLVNEKILEESKNLASQGLRVVALTLEGMCLALITLKDGIRKSAEATLEYFYENGLDVKIISGDNQHTVAKIAAQCGVRNADKAISLEGMEIEDVKKIAEEYTVFARVSPEQKEALVTALKERKHKVAMTGDGVNDILALRKSNCAITFEKATDAAKSCSDVILLDNDFCHLREVVGEGRRVVNNMERSSILFLMKTVCIFLLAFILIPWRAGQMFFTIENIYLVQTSVIAISGFLLSLERRREPIVGSFRRNVFPKAAASGLLLLVGAVVPCVLYLFNLLDIQNTVAMISILTTLAGLTVLFVMSRPFTPYRWVVWGIALAVTAILALALPQSYLGGAPISIRDFQNGTIAREFFQPWNAKVWQGLASQPLSFWIMGGFAIIGIPVYNLIIFLVNRFFEKRLNDDDEDDDDENASENPLRKTMNFILSFKKKNKKKEEEEPKK